MSAATGPPAPVGPLDDFDLPVGLSPLDAFGRVLLAAGVVMHHFPWVVYREPVRIGPGRVDAQQNWSIGATYEAACWQADRECGAWKDRGLNVVHWVDDIRAVAIRGVLNG